MKTLEDKIAKDLELCDLIQAIGSKASKRKAASQRKAIFRYLNETTPPEIKAMSDDELLAALTA